jgi:flagellar hook-associated protein 3 FlgL
MRVATNSVSDNIVSQIQLLAVQQAKLQNQIATGQRISQPEDDPAAVGRVLNLQSELRQITQYGINATSALNVAQASSSGLQAVKKISDRAGELATLGTGVLGPDALSAYGTETDQLIEQAVQEANAKLNGNYLFAGTAVSSPPIVATRNANGQITSVSYAGNSAQSSVSLSEASSVTPSTNGATNSGLADFINNLIALRDALMSGDTSAVSAAQPGLTSSEDVLVSAIADNGGIQTRIEASQSEQSDRTTGVNQLISSETSADLPSTIVKLNQTQTAYQAALQSAANIMKLSLLDYIQ